MKTRYLAMNERTDTYDDRERQGIGLSEADIRAPAWKD